MEMETAKLKIDADVARHRIDAGGAGHDVGLVGGGMNAKIPVFPPIMMVKIV